MWGLRICEEADLGPGTVYPILERLADLASVPANKQARLRRERRYALGLLRAAIGMRIQDFTKLAWRPVDWLLQTDERVFAATLAVAAVMVRDFYASGGISNIFSNWDNLFALGGTTWATTVALRKYRDITPKSPKSRRERDAVDR